MSILYVFHHSVLCLPPDYTGFNTFSLFFAMAAFLAAFRGSGMASVLSVISDGLARTLMPGLYRTIYHFFEFSKVNIQDNVA